MTSKYKTQNDEEKRKIEANKIRERYPDRIPVICEKSETSKLPDIDNTKFLVPNDFTAFHFICMIRKRIKLPEKDCLYFFVNGKNLLKGDTLIAQIYEKKRDPDGFLYIIYTEEPSFGALKAILEDFKYEEWSIANNRN